MLRLWPQLAHTDVRLHTRTEPEPMVASGQTVLEGMVDGVVGDYGLGVSTSCWSTTLGATASFTASIVPWITT